MSHLALLIFYEVVLSFIYQMRKQQLKEVQRCAQGHQRNVQKGT